MENISSLDIYCSLENDMLGIWFNIGGKRYMVDPLELFNSIYENDEYYILDGNDDFVCVKVHQDSDYYVWEQTEGIPNSALSCKFRSKDYVSKIKTCYTQFYNEWMSGKNDIYGKDIFTIEAAKAIVEQLDVVPSSTYNTLKASEIKEEIFKFRTVYGRIDKYQIGIGERMFSTFMTHWDNFFGNVSYDLESLINKGETEIRLSFDTQETIIKIKKVSFQKDLAFVKIIPNCFVDYPIIVGYCDYIQTIKIIYEGMMNFAFNHSYDKPIFNEPKLLDIYNDIKSPLIEAFITNPEMEYNQEDINKHSIKNVLRINPDYDVVIWDSENIPVDVDEDGNIDELHDKQGNPIKIPGLLQWQQEMCTIIIDANTGRNYVKDWVDYHRRGLEFAKLLRSKLSADFDLWYEAPFEDKSGTIPQPMLIYK